MAERFNPLDPLGIFGRVKRDIDSIAGSAKLPVPPSPPGLTTKPHSIGNPIPAEFNGQLVDMRDEARRRLIAAGYSETATDKALNWHDEWIMGIVRMMAPNDMNMQRTLVQKAYSEIAPRAEKWIRGIQDAFGVTA
jgi:hypothetical protein